jgi:pimeloyl-ACP methyl ester carboxylesterase
LPTETQFPEKRFVYDSQHKAIPDMAGITNRTEPKGTAPSIKVEEHWLDLPDGRMRYLKAGTGPPLILIHGLMGYSFSWRFTIPALTLHATVYAIDNLGAGLSTLNKGTICTVRASAERVLQFADAVGIKQFDVLGTSHGGGVAIMLAAICAEKDQKKSPTNDHRLRRLILVAPVNPWSRHGKRLAPFIGSPFGSILFRNIIERWRFLDNLWLRRLFGDESKIPPDSLEGYRMPVIKNHGFRHGSRIVKNWTADLSTLKSALPKIRDYPTLLIWGTKDRAVDFSSAQPLCSNFQDAKLVALQGVGHLPYEESPNKFNNALIDFLTSSECSSSQTTSLTDN